MIKRLRMAALALAALALAVLVPVGTASATTAPGAWWTGHYTTDGFDIQAQYTNSSNEAGLLVRASGWAVTLTSTNPGVLRQIKLDETCHGVVLGSRTVNYTGSAKSSAYYPIPTSYLNFMGNDGTCQAVLSVTTNVAFPYNKYTGYFNIGR